MTTLEQKDIFRQMPRDFTLGTYELLLDAMEGYDVLTVRRYLEERPEKGFIILRHDVDRFPNNAVRMARLEASRDIHSTYYFRVGNRIDEKPIKEISSLGHEIGYHYEVLSKVNGDYEKAIKLFEDELKRLRAISEIKTMSMHGKPLSKWDNSLLWSKYLFGQYGIIGDGTISIKNIPYFTDAGRSWDGSNNIRDHPKNEQNNISVKDTYQIIKQIKEQYHETHYLNTHPERWVRGNYEFVTSLFLDSVINIGKKILHGKYK